VEATFVLSICLLFLFGIFEYGRFLMTVQLLENACREGARNAVAHTNTATTASVQAVVQASLASQGTNIDDLSVTVSGVVLRAVRPGENVGDPLADWTTASTTDGIAVAASGTYTPVLSTLLSMPTIPVSAQAVMYSEGN
jgi:Flp pilus assembly protein TadG